MKHLFTIWFLILTFSGTSAKAHLVEQFYLSLEETGTTWRIDVTFDASYALPELCDDPDSPQPERAWLLGMNPQQHREIQQGAESYLRQALTFTIGGRETPFTTTFPDFEFTPPRFPELATGGAYLTVRLEGHLQNWQRGDLSLAISPTVRPDFVLHMKRDGESQFQILAPGENKPVFNLDQGLLPILILGYRHVIPDGLDHVLFIFALFLMARAWRPLLAQSLAFTLAHSITLGLAISGFINLSKLPGAFLIEPLIALSIVALALENIFRQKVQKRRLLIVFLFGLIHGLGFAESLGSVLQKDSQLLGSLIVANLGVELAQITLLAALWIGTIVWWKSKFYQQCRLAACLLIAAIAISWTIERLIT